METLLKRACAPADAETTGTRREWSLLTDPQVEETWAWVLPRLRATLTRRRLSRADLDDVCQQTFLKAWDHQTRYASPEDLLAWAITVARNHAVDIGRRARRFEAPSEMTAPDDVEHEVITSLHLKDVFRAWQELSDSDRAAILTSRPYADRREATRLAVQRHRARQRLLRLAGGPLSALAGVAATIRRLGRLGPPAIFGATLTVAALAVAPAPAGPAGPVPGEAEAQVHAVLAGPLHPAPHRGSQRRRSLLLPGRAASAKGAQSLVIAPGGHPLLTYEQRAAEPDDRLICAYRVPVVTSICSPVITPLEGVSPLATRAQE